MTSTYPDERFLKGFAPKMSEEALDAVQDTNKPGQRPALQSDLKIQPIDDIYPNGKPCGCSLSIRCKLMRFLDRGSGKLEGKSAWM